MRRCSRLAGPSGALANACASIARNMERRSGCPISEDEDTGEIEGSEESLFSAPSAAPLTDRRDYDSEHYVRVLRGSYAERLRVVFEAEDFSQLFRLDAQTGLFDRPIEQMQLRWIRCMSPKTKK